MIKAVDYQADTNMMKIYDLINIHFRIKLDLWNKKLLKQLGIQEY